MQENLAVDKHDNSNYTQARARYLARGDHLETPARTGNNGGPEGALQAQGLELFKEFHSKGHQVLQSSFPYDVLTSENEGIRYWTSRGSSFTRTRTAWYNHQPVCPNIGGKQNIWAPEMYGNVPRLFALHPNTYVITIGTMQNGTGLPNKVRIHSNPENSDIFDPPFTFEKAAALPYGEVLDVDEWDVLELNIVFWWTRTDYWSCFAESEEYPLWGQDEEWGLERLFEV
ncbi:hypothetical protein K402DRAFT_399465 [Aulographum hederae CBS 113979]|uniref:Uncharacterized protein n=1 Tax=Aulographum hederae CBS 113979 TaxID=1176131 RepID=A0A6G1HGH7_9PEZI|nr:hypothetical protein K402DRAFT_399465 [Aulographum hederae CBS 113979]